MKNLNAIAAFMMLATYCAGSTGPVCHGEAQSCVTEAPAGSVDGKNTRFTLSRVPEPGSAVQIYRNGVHLTLGEDYEASGNTIIFETRETPLPGDFLQAIYEPAARGLQAARSAARVSTFTGGEEISSALARKALSTELGGLSEPKVNREQTGGSSPLLSIDIDSLSASSSHATRGVRRKGKGEPQNTEKSTTVQGVDGLGDNSLGSDSTDSEDSDRSFQSTVHSAVQLLERRLKPQPRTTDLEEASPEKAANNQN